MRTSSFGVGLVVASAVLFGCPSAESLCRSGVDQVCERVHECQSQQVKDSAQFQAAFGTSADNCKELLYANPGRPQGVTAIACADVDNDKELCTNLGQPNATDFDLGNAQKCSDARADMSCTDYLAQLSDPTKAPAECGERCK